MEIWKDIKGYEGRYKVSDRGRVFSLLTNKVLRPIKNGTGYAIVTLRKNRNSFQFLIHRLVADVFIDNPSAYPCVNHKDENKQNNYADNLEWCTYKYNSNYGNAIKRMVEAKDYKTSSLKNTIPVLQYSLDNELIGEWRSAKECKVVLGYDNSNIIKCCRGRARSAYGFKWKYKQDLVVSS
ncbi:MULTISPECIES: NUMOD4 domain-containing protein [Bacillus cereus group]|uniref:NUMOD4 domain-containing protein n=1 Tax=Bacillus cereus group TaxID=86661 RepID=UPI0016814A98|nr:NUMOD4 domain-containing protein [Bacillus cereus]